MSWIQVTEKGLTLSGLRSCAQSPLKSSSVAQELWGHGNFSSLGSSLESAKFQLRSLEKSVNIVHILLEL